MCSHCDLGEAVTSEVQTGVCLKSRSIRGINITDVVGRGQPQAKWKSMYKTVRGALKMQNTLIANVKMTSKRLLLLRFCL